MTIVTGVNTTTGELETKDEDTPRGNQRRMLKRLDQAERDALVCDMAMKGKSLQQIVDANVGFATKGGVSKAIHRALNAKRAQNVDQYRAELLAKLDAVELDAWNDLENPGWKMAATTGIIAKDPFTGEPMIDRETKDRARNTLIKVIKAKAEITGANAPKRTITATFTIEDRARLEAEILQSDSRLSGRAEIVEAEIVSEEAA